MSVTITQPAEATVTVEYNSAAELAEKMLEILDERGWVRADVEDSEGKVCLVGALGLAYGRPAVDGYLIDPEQHRALSELIARVIEFSNTSTGVPYLEKVSLVSLWRFNDTFSDSVGDISAALRYAVEHEPASV